MQVSFGSCCESVGEGWVPCSNVINMFGFGIFLQKQELLQHACLTPQPQLVKHSASLLNFLVIVGRFQVLYLCVT